MNVAVYIKIEKIELHNRIQWKNVIGFVASYLGKYIHIAKHYDKL